MVFAAGNDGSDNDWYPAYYSNAIAVAATDNSGEAAFFTNYGSWVDISAPGYPVFSTVTVADGSFGSYSGTSMACPLVAGVLALGKAQRPDAPTAELLTCLTSSATDISAQNAAVYENGLGAGLVNAADFLTCLGGQPTSAPTSTLSPTVWTLPPPTQTPVACTCDVVLVLRVTTDRWPAENSYKLTSSDSCDAVGQVCVSFFSFEYYYFWFSTYSISFEALLLYVLMLFLKKIR